MEQRCLEYEIKQQGYDTFVPDSDMPVPIPEVTENDVFFVSP